MRDLVILEGLKVERVAVLIDIHTSHVDSGKARAVERTRYVGVTRGYGLVGGHNAFEVGIEVIGYAVTFARRFFLNCLVGRDRAQRRITCGRGSNGRHAAG